VARTDKARLFVALDLPEPARAALVEWQARAVAGRPELRPVAPAALHVTLAFLGQRPVAEIDAIADAVEGAVHGLAPARLTPLAAKPVPRRQPRLFALDLDDEDGHAAAVNAAITRALVAGGYYEPERRAFWPHVTVARVGRAERAAAPLTDPPPEQPFTAREVVLYRSHLGRGPARYEALRRRRL
jgi:2'-5' RNA ligase